MINKELQKRILSSLVLIPIALFFIIKGSYFFNFFILICLLVSIHEWHLMSKKKVYKIPGIIFLIISFYSAYYLRNEMYGDYLYFIMILFICICYFAASLKGIVFTEQILVRFLILVITFPILDRGVGTIKNKFSQ